MQPEAADRLGLVAAQEVLTHAHQRHGREATLGVDVDVELDLVGEAQEVGATGGVGLEVERHQRAVGQVVELGEPQPVALREWREQRLDLVATGRVVQPEGLERAVPERHRVLLRLHRHELFPRDLCHVHPSSAGRSGRRPLRRTVAGHGCPAGGATSTFPAAQSCRRSRSTTTVRASRVSASPSPTAVPTGWSGTGRDHDLPGVLPPVRRHRDLDRVGLGVEPEQERAVPLLLAARPGGAQRVAGDQHARPRQRVVRPVVARSSRARSGAARSGPWVRPRSSAGPRTSAAAAAPGAHAVAGAPPWSPRRRRATRRRRASRPTRSRCPARRGCCCRPGCGRARRRRVIIGTPFDRHERHHQVRGDPTPQRRRSPGRPSRPRPRSSATGCCRSRRGCPRRWPGCASARRRPRRAP